MKYNIIGWCFGLRQKQCGSFTCRFDRPKAEVHCPEFCDGHDGDIRQLRTSKWQRETDIFLTLFAG